MKKSRLSFARYSPSRRKQRRKQIVLASGIGLCVLLMGATVFATKYSRPWGQQDSVWLSFHEPNSSQSRHQSDTAVLQLAFASPKERTRQLEAIAHGPKSLNRSRARYLLASDAIAQKQGQKALSWLKELEWDYPVLAAHIKFKRAQAYELTGKKAKAVAEWEDLLKRYSDQPVAAEALYALSASNPNYQKKAIPQRTSEELSEALAPRSRLVEMVQQWYAVSADDPFYWEKALRHYPSHPRILEIARQQLKKNPNQPQLMLLLARYSFDSPDITDVLDQLVGKYGKAVLYKDHPVIEPEDWEAIALGYWNARKYGQASEAYANAPRTPRNVYLAALGLQYAEKYAEAKQAYEQMLRDFPTAKESADALLQIAKIEPESGVVPYLDQAIRQFPDRAGEALLAKAEALDELKVSQAAANARQSLLTQYGSSDAAADYRWAMAQAQAADGDIEGALAWARPIPSQNPDSFVARQAGFWVGKWASKLGNQQEARAAFERVITKYPHSYYAWRSAVMLGWNVGDFTTVRKQNPQVVWPTERPKLPVGSAALQELYQLGQAQDAWKLWQAEFKNRMQPAVAEQFTDGLMLMAAGDYLEGISRISSLEDREKPEEQEQYKVLSQQMAYWQALYPVPYQKVIETYAKQRQINPLLVTAVIRQESRFEPEIRSTAGAVGLMQVLPSIGAKVAQNLNLKNYSLSNPDDNIKLGTWLLQETHQAHKNNSLLAVASYNAGQGNTSQWLAGKGSIDPDEFVESIPFGETRDYVKQVFGNYWNYLRLYEPQVQAKLAKYSASQSTAMKR